MKHPLALASIAPTAHAGSSTALLKGAQALRVRYFGSLDQETPPPWHDSCRYLPTSLTLLVSVEVTFAQGDRRQWVALVAGPALAP